MRISSLSRLHDLVSGLRRAPPGRGRIATAAIYGLVCHAVFGVAVLAMIVAMFFGMSRSFGEVPQPWAWAANLALQIQFPLAHSFLLTRRGRALLERLAPAPHGRTLATTTYAIIASAQLLALFTLWTPSGIVWWRAEGGAFWALCCAYAASWLLLVKASLDAGPELQSGALGWMSLAGGVRAVFPDMPTRGLFRLIRQPIYVAFALTLWTPPVWTPDQLLLAVGWTGYCLLAPRLKERRFERIYGDCFRAYRARVPYAAPLPRRRKTHG